MLEGLPNNGQTPNQVDFMLPESTTLNEQYSYPDSYNSSSDSSFDSRTPDIDQRIKESENDRLFNDSLSSYDDERTSLFVESSSLYEKHKSVAGVRKSTVVKIKPSNNKFASLTDELQSLLTNPTLEKPQGPLTNEPNSLTNRPQGPLTTKRNSLTNRPLTTKPNSLTNRPLTTKPNSSTDRLTAAKTNNEPLLADGRTLTVLRNGQTETDPEEERRESRQQWGRKQSTSVRCVVFFTRNL